VSIHALRFSVTRSNLIPSTSREPARRDRCRGLFLELRLEAPPQTVPLGLPLGDGLLAGPSGGALARVAPQGLGSVSRGRRCPSLSTLPLVAAFPPLYEEVLRGYEAAAGRYAVPWPRRSTPTWTCPACRTKWNASTSAPPSKTSNPTARFPVPSKAFCPNSLFP